MVIGNRAIIYVMPRQMTLRIDDLLSELARESDIPPIFGWIPCPRACGTRIFWALSGELAEHKEVFLTYLNQQLCWTACPDHQRVEAQHTNVNDEEHDWARWRSKDPLFGKNRLFQNSLE